jgi:hypothetical protein
MDSMDASCVFYAKVGKLNHLECNKIWLVTVNKAGIVWLTVEHDVNVSVSLIYYPGDFLRQISENVLFLKDGPMYI